MESLNSIQTRQTQVYLVASRYYCKMFWLKTTVGVQTLMLSDCFEIHFEVFFHLTHYTVHLQHSQIKDILL